mmetsp:Transcript_24769/g.27559  ORF Transcript_24769/g.27559 Transcript_24769/m.27559 type:complete len:189 (+) Transcript_24769:700-1266(+)
MVQFEISSSDEEVSYSSGEAPERRLVSRPTPKGPLRSVPRPAPLVRRPPKKTIPKYTPKPKQLPYVPPKKGFPPNRRPHKEKKPIPSPKSTFKPRIPKPKSPAPRVPPKKLPPVLPKSPIPTPSSRRPKPKKPLPASPKKRFQRPVKQKDTATIAKKPEMRSQMSMADFLTQLNFLVDQPSAVATTSK